MKDIVRKYAKDLIEGDKVNGHEKGWLTVLEVERIHLTTNTRVLFAGDETSQIVDSHTIFDSVLTER